MTHHAKTLPTGTVLALLLLSAGSSAQFTNPAQAVSEQKPEERPTYTTEDSEVLSSRFFLDHETELVGSYGQPRWTTRRRFPTTRVYVIPEGAFGFEYWLEPKVPEHGPARVRHIYEFELGLPGRFQVDLYMVTVKEGESSETGDEAWVELRYAFADWGKIWGNPTAYFEVKTTEGPSVLEGKLLLGDQIGNEWYWGANLVFEHETSGEFENTYELTGAISHATTDSNWSWGGEFKAELVDVASDRGTYEEALLVGPSFQYRPTPRIHIDVAPLVGIGNDSPDFRGYFVIGYSF